MAAAPRDDNVNPNDVVDDDDDGHENDDNDDDDDDDEDARAMFAPSPKKASPTKTPLRATQAHRSDGDDDDLLLS